MYVNKLYKHPHKINIISNINKDNKMLLNYLFRLIEAHVWIVKPSIKKQQTCYDI